MGLLRRKPVRPQPPQARDANRAWVDGFVAYSAGECHLADNTVAAYRRDLLRFLAWLGGRSIPALSIRDLADYAGWLHHEKLGPASIARHLVSLKVFFRYLQLEGVLQDNLAELLGSQKLWERVPKVLSPQQIDRLLASPTKRDACWRRDRALLELLYATGCRASEISGLKLPDLHLDQGFCLCHGKGDKQRIVMLGGRAVAAVGEYFEHERPGAGREIRDHAAVGAAVVSRPATAAGADLGAAQALRPAGGRARGGQPPHATAQLRHAHARRRDGPSPGPGDARPREHRDDANLHARRHVASEGGAPAVPSPGVTRLQLPRGGANLIFSMSLTTSPSGVIWPETAVMASMTCLKSRL